MNRHIKKQRKRRRVCLSRRKALSKIGKENTGNQFALANFTLDAVLREAKHSVISRFGNSRLSYLALAFLD